MRWLSVVVALVGCGRFGFEPRGAPGDSDDAPLADTPPITPAAVFDVASSTAAVNATSLAWSHTVATGDAALVVFVGTRNNGGGPTVTSLTYGGQTLQKIVALCAACGSLNNDNYEMWYLTAPPAGTQTISVTLAGSAFGASGLAASYVGTAATMTTYATNYGTSSAASLSWAPPAGTSWMVSATMVQGGASLALTPGPGQVTRVGPLCDTNQWQGQALADQLAVNASSVGMTWSIGTGGGTACSTGVAGTGIWISLGASFQ